jgi:hypothetical protein
MDRMTHLITAQNKGIVGGGEVFEVFQVDRYFSLVSFIRSVSCRGKRIAVS